MVWVSVSDRADTGTDARATGTSSRLLGGFTRHVREVVNRGFDPSDAHRRRAATEPFAARQLRCRAAALLSRKTCANGAQSLVRRVPAWAPVRTRAQ